MSRIQILARTVLLATFIPLLCLGCDSETPEVTDGDSVAPTSAIDESETGDQESTTDTTPVENTSDEIVPVSSEELLQPEDLTYQGAFRLPGESGGSNWEYSGYAMTFYPEGDPNGPDDGYPGSLFAVGHDHHQQVSEISIPSPVVSADANLELLNRSETLQGFQDVQSGFYGELEIPRAGLEYLPAQDGEGSGKLHFAWGQHFEDQRTPSHGWCELDLANPESQGPWSMGDYTNYITNDYLFEIPEEWSRANAPGLRLATGRFRDGLWGGRGPALLAYAPPSESDPLGSGATIENVQPLLLYGIPDPNTAVPEIITTPEQTMIIFAEPDEWSGGAWLTAGERSSVVLIGTKATGRSWYGFGNGVEYPISGVSDAPIPDVPPWPHDSRGWWSEDIEAQILFFNPNDLAAVVSGEMETWEPQPYAVLTIDEYLFEPGYDHDQQKRYLVGAAAFDRACGNFYVIERRADEGKSLVHVFQVE